MKDLDRFLPEFTFVTLPPENNGCPNILHTTVLIEVKSHLHFNHLG